MPRFFEDPEATAQPDKPSKPRKSKSKGSHEPAGTREEGDPGPLPVDGKKQWNHKPNAASLVSDTTESKVYQVAGTIDTTFTGGNCSAATYTTRFTVIKHGGVVQLKPHTGSLAKYDDFDVTPSTSPTDIPC